MGADGCQNVFRTNAGNECLNGLDQPVCLVLDVQLESGLVFTRKDRIQ
jgi:hypothetical protein